MHSKNNKIVWLQWPTRQAPAAISMSGRHWLAQQRTGRSRPPSLLNQSGQCPTSTRLRFRRQGHRYRVKPPLLRQGLYKNQNS